MSDPKTAYPLCWPLSKPGTIDAQRKVGRFKTSFAEARDACILEIRRLNGSEAIVSTNIPLKRDGFPYAEWGKHLSGKNPGVAVYFKRKGKELCFACDIYVHVQDNMTAICRTIEALRGIARWGTGDMMEAAFTGFAALPAPGQSGGDDPYKTLGLPINASEEQLTAAYRLLSKKFHPDNQETGDATHFMRIKSAYDLIAQNLRK